MPPDRPTPTPPASVHLSAPEAEALRQVTLRMTLGRTLPELAGDFARALAPLIDFQSLVAKVPGETPVRVGPDGKSLDVDPPGSTTCVLVKRPVPGGGEMGVTLYRVRVLSFSRRDVMILELAAPVFAWAASGRSISVAATRAAPVPGGDGTLLPASGTLLLSPEGRLLGSDGTGLRLAEACCTPGAGPLPGPIEAAARELAGSPETDAWTKELTVPLFRGGFVRARLARVGGRNPSLVAFLGVISGSGAPAESESIRAGLTRREREVAEAAARGLSNPQIAKELKISVETVKQHIATVLEKTGVSSRNELVGRLFPERA